MAEVVSPTRHDATLSKTLIDAKQRLGSVYFEARLLECPKNAIELKKLLRKYDALEKEYIRDVLEVKRGQQMLSLSLTNYLKSDTPMTTQELLGKNRTEALTMPLPPGFRFHSNGEPKQMQLKETRFQTDDHICWQKSKSLKPQHSSLLDSIHTASEGDGRSITSDRNTANDHAVSQNNKRKTKGFHRNERFAFKPGTINFGKSDGKILKVGKCRRSSLRTACSACQFKLKYSDEAMLKMQQTQREPLLRWQIAPTGCYVKAPFSHGELDKMVSDINPVRQTLLSPGCPGSRSAPNHMKLVPSMDSTLLPKDRLSLSSGDNRRLASSPALVSMFNKSPPDKRKSSLHKTWPPKFTTKSVSALNEERKSSVSFSPFTTGVSLYVNCTPSAGAFVDRLDSQNTFAATVPSLDLKPHLPALSVRYWKPILEEETQQCSHKVEQFLKKLPGQYTPRFKPERNDLLPWARRKDLQK